MIIDAVREALATVDDPEYPGISIVDLGLVERVSVDDDGAVQVGLIPTFSGCPALAVIAADVKKKVGVAEGVRTVKVEWLTNPAWSTDRVRPAARDRLADEFTVAVELTSGSAICPLCGEATSETSMFGPSRCRSVHVCESCSENVEVMRG